MEGKGQFLLVLQHCKKICNMETKGKNCAITIRARQVNIRRFGAGSHDPLNRSKVKLFFYAMLKDQFPSGETPFRIALEDTADLFEFLLFHLSYTNEKDIRNRSL